MKTLPPLTSATLVVVLFLSGCTDPKAPKVPEPKAVTLVVPASPHALPLNDRVPA